jgi:hypothetical protein
MHLVYFLQLLCRRSNGQMPTGNLGGPASKSGLLNIYKCGTKFLT